jgi:amino acid adenylation domain-containing protein
MQQEVIEGFRLSPHQNRLWLVQGTSSVYRAQAAVLLEGALSVESLKTALLKVVDRHEILRTTFDWLPGMKLPVQVIGNAGTPLWRRIDLSASEEQTQVLAELLQEDRLAPFDFARGPLMRCTLVCLKPDQHFLLLTFPALCADARSLSIIVSEIAGSFEACPEENNQPEETVQYSQFAEWQIEVLEDDKSETGREFWSQHGSTDATPLSLPTENRVALVPLFKPEVWCETLGIEVFARIKAIAIHQDISPAVLMLACWQTLLWRLTGEANVLVSLRSDGRVYEEMREAVGLYEKWLPVQCPFARDFHFREILQQTDKAVKEVHEWQEYFSPEHDAGASAVPTATAGAIGFAFEEWPTAHSAGGVRFSLITQYSCTERFKLKLSCVQRSDSLNLEFHYDPAFFAAGAIRSIGEQLTTLLKTVLLNTDLPVGELEILGDVERHRLLVEWNDTAIEFRGDQCLPELFEAQVERTPDAVAVVSEDGHLSYRELNHRANELAHHLRRCGVRAETRVALCLDRSVDMLVGVLGVWKSGGVYVPLDPMQPKLRLGFMIADAQVHLVLSIRKLEPLLREQDAPVVFLDSQWPEIAQEGGNNPQSNIFPGNLAYVIYTSGSTGQPKGTMVEHRSVVNLAKALEQDIYGPSESALRVSLNAPLAFDSSIKQILQLLAGHTLYVLPEDVRRDGHELLSYVKQHALDGLDCTPSQLRLLVEAGLGDSKNPAPKLALIGGEPLDSELWQILAQHEETTYYNVYGPTECTVDATACRVGQELIQPSIGRPLANMQTYVLDDQLNPVPVGIKGELYIGGAGLARGYLDRPELTAERFIPHPFSDQPGSRMYKTGDLVRYSSDGNLEFLERVDYQVKIRGSRIELGEIEAVLATHPAIRSAVVLARESTPGNQRLVAYFVTGSPVPSTHELHSFLHERLPDYMMPAAFVPLDAMPLTSSGKIDRRALPAPDQVRPKLDEDYLAPRTQTEDLLAGIWAHVLGLERAGVNDNFFEMGGHSLLATQVISQVRQAFQVEIPLRNIFETPTIAGLAESIEKESKTAAGVENPPLERVSRDQKLPLSFAQQRLWFLEQLDPGNTAYHVPYALRLSGFLDTTALERSLGEIVRRHEVLRTTFVVVKGESEQVIHPAQACLLDVMDLRESLEDDRQAEARRLINEEARRPFDLEQGPLLRASLLQLNDREHILVLAMHHIVFDAWSIGVLVQEVVTLYEAFTSGQPSPLPELPVQYADFAHWQRSWLQGETLDRHLDYWKGQLADLTTLELPTDRPRPPVQSFRGARQSLTMPGSLVSSLYELSRNQGVTLFMTLLAAFQTLLHRYTAQVDISLGTPIANRNHREIEGLIGFFINTLVLRTDLSGNPSFVELLRRVREVALNAYAHQDLPFEKLVEEFQPDRNLSRTPFFQVLFTVRKLGAGTTLKLSNLEMHGLEMESETAKFDLLMLVDESDQGINFGLEYNTDLFDHSTITHMLGHFQTLLEDIVADSQQRLSELSLLTATERQQMLVGWNETGRQYPQDVCVHQLFEAQVERTPDAVAVVFEEERLTYSELNQRSNQVANYLRARGVGPEVRVGILMERSLEMVIGLLGIIKAGGAYLPLDLSYPLQRMSFMLTDADVAVLLTQQALQRDWRAHSIDAICLDADWPDIAGESTETPDNTVTAGNPAYVIYTSGSTGQPKGVVIPHQAIGNHMHWMQEQFPLAESDRILQKTPISFDASVWEFLAPLMSGAQLVMARPDGHRDGAYLVEAIRRYQITTIQLVPSLLRLLLDEPGFSDCRTLKRVFCGGEALSAELVERFSSCLDAELINLYGPTEASIDATYWTNQDAPPMQKVPIGRPISNMRVYLLDKSLEPVPVGVSTEVYISGRGLARGYLKRPELTAAQFVPDPFSGTPGGRLYKTGDLARYLPDGNIEYVGRLDDQVKLRGFRVELSEIETVLNEHPEVRESVVLVRESAPGDERLVAYVVPHQSPGPGVSELRDHLKVKLPDYMMPSAFMFLDALPLTPNGKIDRRALPAPGSARRETEEVSVAPRTAVEETIAAIWSAVLGTDQVGVYDNFFELGGHSLLATQVIGRLREVFPIELPLRTLFESPTVAALAERLAEEPGQAEELEDIARTLQELAELSDGDVEALLEKERLSVEANAQ